MLSLDEQLRRQSRVLQDEAERLFTDLATATVSLTTEAEYLSYMRSLVELVDWIEPTISMRK